MNTFTLATRRQVDIKSTELEHFLERIAQKIKIKTIKTKIRFLLNHFVFIFSFALSSGLSDGHIMEFPIKLLQGSEFRQRSSLVFSNNCVYFCARRGYCD